VKLLRTIQLDPSDTFVFEQAAEPGEWAVSGAFAFWNSDPAMLEGKARTAFRSGFLGVSTLGWSTLVQIVDATESDRLALVDRLAEQLMSKFGAPTRDDAIAAADEEITFVESLCNQPSDTLIAVHRTFRCIAHLKTAPCGNRFAHCVRVAGQSLHARSHSSRSKARTSSLPKTST